MAKTEMVTPPPEPRELPRDWQNWTICTKGSCMLIKFTEKNHIIKSFIRVTKVSIGKLRVAKVILLM